MSSGLWVNGQVADFQTEKQFSDAVVEYARLCGWLVHRDPTWRATGADPGYPDLTLVGLRGDLIFAELKVGKGKLTDRQKDWALRLSRNEHADYHVWTPEDWPEIEKALQLQRQRRV